MRKIKHRYEGVEYYNANSFKLVFKDVFSFEYLYKLLHEWLLEKGYAPTDDSKFGEVYYLQKEDPKSGKGVTIRWRLSKIPEDSSNLFRYDIDIDINVLGLKEVEVPYKNKKIKGDQGEIEIQCRGNLIMDPEGKWEKNSWLKPFKKFIIYKLLRNKYDKHRFDLYGDVEKFQEAIKNYFQIPAYSKDVKFSEFWEKRFPE
ncbi:hypothetical protein HY837_07060 [archaeon]|nr:hypothetical protein [archaeon]